MALLKQLRRLHCLRPPNHGKEGVYLYVGSNLAQFRDMQLRIHSFESANPIGIESENAAVTDSRKDVFEIIGENGM